MAAKGEDLDAEKGDRHAEDGGEQVARERRQAEQIVADEDDGVLDDVIRHVREEKLHVARERHARREDEEAVEQIRIAIAQQIADVECEVRIVDERLEDRREEAAEEGVERADDEEEQEGAREEVVLDGLPVNPHGQAPALLPNHWPWRWPKPPPRHRGRARGLRACRARGGRADGASSPCRCGRDTRR